MTFIDLLMDYNIRTKAKCLYVKCNKKERCFMQDLSCLCVYDRPFIIFLPQRTSENMLEMKKQQHYFLHHSHPHKKVNISFSVDEQK